MNGSVGALPLSDFDYEYPQSQVALAAAEPRDGARLLVLDRGVPSALSHAHFRDLPRYLSPGDCLVVNRTKVLPCRLLGRKATGGKADLLLVRELEPQIWTALASGFKAGQTLEFPGMTATVEGLAEDGEYRLRFETANLRAYLAAHGLPPLPLYIAKKRAASRADAARYQTVYARDDGSIAAPTAGMHFTPELLAKLKESGVTLAAVTLHIGRGTFRPITSDDAASHRMLPEWYEVESDAVKLIAAARARGGRVVSVGTTTTRTLETLAARPEGFGPGTGKSSLYITPGHRFRAIDALITNFHLPRSTPLLLACAFAGRERLLGAYREAVARGYRLYSYGDATLLL